MKYRLSVSVVIGVLALMVSGTSMSAPLESGAVIQEGINEKAINAAVRLIQLSGYKCDSVSAIRRFFLSGRGFVVQCNRFSYKYEIEDRGGKWVVCYRSCS